MERFSCKTKIISGSGAVSALRELHPARLFLVSDPYFSKNGTAERIARESGAAVWELFDQVEPDPNVQLAAQGAARLRSFQPDWIVALGGGSAIDLAKAISCFAGDGIRLAAIPTTSGSGSEVTDFAILTHGDVKHPLIDVRLRPDVAILDADLLTELPPSLIADAGFDVLAHATEAYVAKNAGAFTDCLARDAFSTAFAALPASFAGNTEVRQRVHTASSMAGLAFNQAGLGLCHAMSHALGGRFHIPHGRLNAILLPAVIRCNARQCAQKYAQLARAAGLGGSTDSMAVRMLCNALVRLRQNLRLPATLAQAGVDPRQVWQVSRAVVETALADPCCETNPVTPEDFMVRSILDEVTGRI